MSILLFLAWGGPSAHARTGLYGSPLGGPTSAIFPGSPFAYLVRGAPVLQLDGKPELLTMGPPADTFAGMDRWSMVKALSQFGSFAGQLAPYETDQSQGTVYTYDWRKATYISPYVAFVHYDDFSATPGLHGHFLHMPKLGKELWHKYSKICSKKIQDCSQNVMQIGSYYRFENKLLRDEFQTPDHQPIPFDTIRSMVRKGYAPPHYSQLVFDIDAETNSLTALICHADGKKPASVCGRKVIKTLMKHLR